MNRLNPYARIVPALALVLALAGCNQNPADDVEAKPAETATQAPGTGATAAATVPAAESAIFYAQVGSSLNEAGYIAESLATLGTQDATYAMSVFRGKDGATGQAGVTVTAADGRKVFKETRDYTIDGETEVVFNVAPAGGGLAAGNYKALFTCNGGPCWEVPFSVK